MHRGVHIGVSILGVLCLFSSVHALDAHISPYGQDAVYFERAALKSSHAPTPQLDRVFGGVVTHHIPNAASLIVDFYSRLAAGGEVDTFVIMGPDHFERGSATVTVSSVAHATQFGIAHPDMALINSLVEGGFATHDEAAFDDHAFHSQLLAITRLFPRAKIVPLLFRSKGSNSAASALGRHIAENAGPRTVIVASVDFSHYLTTQQAYPLDYHAARTLATLRPELAGIAEADSPQALTSMIAAVQALGATATQTLGIHNSDEFSAKRSDVTTGYIMQLYGTPKQYGIFAGVLDRIRYNYEKSVL